MSSSISESIFFTWESMTGNIFPINFRLKNCQNHISTQFHQDNVSKYLASKVINRTVKMHATKHFLSLKNIQNIKKHCIVDIKSNMWLAWNIL